MGIVWCFFAGFVNVSQNWYFFVIAQSLAAAAAAAADVIVSIVLQAYCARTYVYDVIGRVRVEIFLLFF